MTRDRSIEHVDLVAGPQGQGAWLSDRAADRIGVTAGDRVVLSGGGSPTHPSRPMEVPIAGVFADLAGTELDDYWCSQDDALDLSPQGDPPPPLLLVDRETFFEALARLELNGATATWEAALRTDGLTVAHAAETVEGIENTEPHVQGPDGFLPVTRRSHLPFVIDRTRSIRTAVGGGVGPVAGFAALAGAVLVGAAGSLWFDRRRSELTVLALRGVGPAALGVKALLELLAALVVGTAAGGASAYALVVALGPSSTLEPAAVQRALGWALAALVAAALLWAVVAGRARGHAHHGVPRGRARLAGVPWEVGLAAATVLAHARLDRWGVPSSRGSAVTRVDALGLLFPVLFLVTSVAVLTRGMALVVVRLRSASGTWPTPLFLAIRRITDHRAAAIGLLAASALAAGVFVYAATLTRSLRTTLETKARTFVGSDIAVRTYGDQPLPAALDERATEVEVFHGARVVGVGSPADRVDVLAIDPETFQGGAFWHGNFSDASLADLLGRLSAEPADGGVPALVVGGTLPETADVELRRRSDVVVTITQVAAARAFPGMSGHRPTVVVAADAVADVDLAQTTETWIRGDPGETLASLDRAGVGARVRRDLDSVVDRTSFLTVSWTFGFMQSLGVATALLIIGGLALYLDARRRSRILAYALARRMGLLPRSHRRAVLVELTATMALGAWLGLLLALTGARLAYERIDPLPDLPPGPLLEPSLLVVLGLAVAAGSLAVVAAHLAQRRVDADSPVEVLRAGA